MHMTGGKTYPQLFQQNQHLLVKTYVIVYVKTPSAI